MRKRLAGRPFDNDTQKETLQEERTVEDNKSKQFPAINSVAEMAKAVVQAQSQLSKNENANLNQDILHILGNLSSQLEKLSQNKNLSNQSAWRSPNKVDEGAEQGQYKQKEYFGNNQKEYKKNKSVSKKTISEILSQKQYELADELEASLQKLKKVISESEKLTLKITNLLGEENKNKNR